MILVVEGQPAAHHLVHDHTQPPPVHRPAIIIVLKNLKEKAAENLSHKLWIWQFQKWGKWVKILLVDAITTLSGKKKNCFSIDNHSIAAAVFWHHNLFIYNFIFIYLCAFILLNHNFSLQYSRWFDSDFWRAHESTKWLPVCVIAHGLALCMFCTGAISQSALSWNNVLII